MIDDVTITERATGVKKERRCQEWTWYCLRLELLEYKYSSICQRDEIPRDLEQVPK